MKTLAISLLAITLSCTKEEPKTILYRTIYEKARAFDEKVHEVMIMGDATDPRRVHCKNYSKACLKGTGKRWKVRSIEMPLIGFTSEEEAKKEAVRLDQYHYKNWLFDQVNNEPVLESFLFSVYGIKKARTKKD